MLAIHSAYIGPPLQWGAVISASLVAAAFDVRSRRIPNWLTGSLFLLGLVWTTSTHGWQGLWSGLEGALLLGLPYVLLFLFASGGAADAKMMGAIGMWLGPWIGLRVLAAVMIAGAVIGIAYAARKRRLATVAANMTLIASGFAQVATGGQKLEQVRETFPDPNQMLTVPYGLAILAGTILGAVWICLRHTGT